MDKLYENIRNRRLELGFSQQDIADRVGYKSGSAVNKIEMGQRDISASMVIKFAAALKTSAPELMGIAETKEEVILHKLEKMTERQKDRVLDYIDYVMWSDKIEIKTPAK